MMDADDNGSPGNDISSQSISATVTQPAAIQLAATLASTSWLPGLSRRSVHEGGTAVESGCHSQPGCPLLARKRL